jgi:hypothetical protein
MIIGQTEYKELKKTLNTKLIKLARELGREATMSNIRDNKKNKEYEINGLTILNIAARNEGYNSIVDIPLYELYEKLPSMLKERYIYVDTDELVEKYLGPPKSESIETNYENPCLPSEV